MCQRIILGIILSLCKGIRCRWVSLLRHTLVLLSSGMTLTLEKPNHSAFFWSQLLTPKCSDDGKVKFKEGEEDRGRGKRFYKHLMTSFYISFPWTGSWIGKEGTFNGLQDPAEKCKIYESSNHSNVTDFSILTFFSYFIALTELWFGIN